MKSKEPKQPKEKKSEAKPRKTGEKAKRVAAQVVNQPQASPVGASPVEARRVEARLVEVRAIEAGPVEASPAVQQITPETPRRAESSPEVFASKDATNGSANGSAHSSHAAAADHPGTIEMVAIEARPSPVDPPEELIRLRAYELFVTRGCRHGHHLEDWLAAEREVKNKHRAA